MGTTRHVPTATQAPARSIYHLTYANPEERKAYRERVYGIPNTYDRWLLAMHAAVEHPIPEAVADAFGILGFNDYAEVTARVVQVSLSDIHR